jgi:hypothetical protein
MNKLQSWLTIGTVPIWVVGAIALFSQASKASEVQVTCMTDASTPRVIISLNQQGTTKDYTILKFVPEYFSPTDAGENCQHTAQKLQAMYDTGSSRYLTTDKLNEQPVVCSVERRGIGCNHHSAEILFSLNPTVNPAQALYEMLGSDFKQAQRLNTRTISRTYTDTRPIWWPRW